jgi:hypothetical protein
MLRFYKWIYIFLGLPLKKKIAGLIPAKSTSKLCIWQLTALPKCGE